MLLILKGKIDFRSGILSGTHAVMDTTSMGPMVPEEASSRLLEDDMLALVAEANRLAGRIHPILLDSIGMLTAASHRAPRRLAFPVDVAERWFPNLYPANAGSRT